MSKEETDAKTNVDVDVKEENTSVEEVTEVKNEKEKKVFITILQTTKEMIIRGILFCIVYLVINRFYKVFLNTK